MKKIIFRKSEKSVKQDLDDTLIDGVASYYDVPLDNFNKQQLIAIIVLTTFEKSK